MKNLKYNIYLKAGIIFFIALLLLAAVSLVTGLTRERQSLQNETISDISGKWGNAQTITGPVLTVPYYRIEKQLLEDKRTKLVKYKEHIHILPESLNINGDIIPQKKHRNIYETVVYNSSIQIQGTFKDINIETLNIDPENILWDKAELTLGITDLKGIENQILLNLNGKETVFGPGSAATEIIYSGVKADFPEIDPKKAENFEFSLNLNLKGSRKLYFVPVGKTSEVQLKSPWKDPSFNGAFLPKPTKPDNKGFTANWKVLNLNRNFPQLWTNNEYNFASSEFGVDLLLPVNNYQKIMRTVKYAILFIFFTFITFFFTEILKKKFIHPIQYILVGASLVIFYILLLSFTEQLNYNYAFIISAAATILLIALYIRAILKSTPIALIISGLLTLLYTFIFVIIQMQDYSLLIGSIGLFGILALIMYLSRNVDWYTVNSKVKNNNEQSNNEQNKIVEE